MRLFYALLISGDHCIGQTIQGRPERSCEAVLATIVAKVPHVALRVRVRDAEDLRCPNSDIVISDAGNRKPEHGQADNISLKGYGTDTEYTLRRLKRDAPESQDANSHLDPLMTLEVIPAADHFQTDVEVIVSLPASGQWLRGCGGQ